MGKYLGLVIGAVVTLAGLIGLIGWRSDLLTVLKGSVPLVLIFGGGIALVAALSELKDFANSKKEEKK